MEKVIPLGVQQFSTEALHLKGNINPKELIVEP